MADIDIRTNIKGLIMDMDGVIWQGDQLLVDLTNLIHTIKDNNWKFLFATNNSSKTVDQYLQKFGKFGVQLEPWQIVNSAEATAAYLTNSYPEGTEIYVIGEHGLRTTLEKYHFRINPDNPKIVVVGIDRQLSYEKLKIGSLAIQRGAIFIGTNPDNSFPTPEGQIPGAGAVIAAIETTTGVSPVIIGKPGLAMFQLSQQRLKIKNSEILMVGDRLETDIHGAQKAGMHSALVLSGVTNKANAQNWEPPPDIIADNLSVLINMLAVKI